MKVAIVIADGIRQVMFTSENPMEQQALDMLGKPDQSISIDIKQGGFYQGMPSSAHGFSVAETQGGYLRAYADSKTSLMLVLRDKKPEPIQDPVMGPGGPEL